MLPDLRRLSLGAPGAPTGMYRGPVTRSRRRARLAPAHADPIEAWMRCGPAAVRHTVVGGRPIVRDGALVHPGVDGVLAAHRVAAEAMQRHA